MTARTNVSILMEIWDITWDNHKSLKAPILKTGMMPEDGDSFVILKISPLHAIIRKPGKRFNMTALSHAIIGAAIALKIKNPAIAGSVAFGTHFICDAIPHWDLGTNWRLRPKIVTGTLAICETLFSIVVVFWLFLRLVGSPALLLLTMSLSLLPDWLEVPYYITMPHSPKIFYYVYKVQSYIHSRLEAPWGILTQIVVVGLFLLVGLS